MYINITTTRHTMPNQNHKTNMLNTGYKSVMLNKDHKITPTMPKYTINKTIEDYTILQLVQDIKMGPKMTESIPALGKQTSTHSLNNILIEVIRIEWFTEVPTLIILVTINTEMRTISSNHSSSMKTTTQETLTITDDFRIPILLTILTKS